MVMSGTPLEAEQRLTVVVALVEHGLQGRQTSVAVERRLAPQHVESFWTRDQAAVP